MQRCGSCGFCIQLEFLGKANGVCDSYVPKPNVVKKNKKTDNSIIAQFINNTYDSSKLLTVEEIEDFTNKIHFNKEFSTS